MTSSRETKAVDTRDVFPVVGLGASAGGMEAFRRFFEALPQDTGMAFVVVQHLSPEQGSDLDKILGRFTSMPVCQVRERTKVAPNHVYVIPPRAALVIEDGMLCLHEPSKDRRVPSSIDHFFESLARERGEQAIAIVLSGSQGDGARGVVAIKRRGGLALVQSPDEAEYESMPESTIGTGRVDLVAPAAELASRLMTILERGTDEELAPGEPAPDDGRVDAEPQTAEESDDEGAYLKIMAHLSRVTGHDFVHYKRATMLRRLDRRVRLHQLTDLPAYLKYLRKHEDEAEALAEELLITVTEFFRDPEAFAALKESVIAELFGCDKKESRDEAQVRVWVPGCATGEEAYSIAMLLAEESAERKVQVDFKIFATDLDRRGIAEARRGFYSEAACENISPERLERFFTKDHGGYQVSRRVREHVVFAIHDVLQDPPFARQDLVSCRNLLIYLDATAQQKAFEVFHYALVKGGTLFLGSAESAEGAKELFHPSDKRHGIYRARGETRRLPAPLGKEEGAKRKGQQAGAVQTRDDGRGRALEHLHHKLLSRAYAPPSLIVDREFQILHMAGPVDQVLRVPSGPPTSDILKSVRPELRLKTRLALVAAFDGKESQAQVVFSRGEDDHPILVDLRAHPMPEMGKAENGLVQLVFNLAAHDGGSPLDQDVESRTMDESTSEVVQKLEEELQMTGEELRRTVEQHEAHAEELTTSNEELLTMNEELQSTSEELETSKEELQSTNEELTTVNQELGNKITELGEVNDDLSNLLAATEIGTIFLNESLCIKRFSAPVTGFFNLVASDVGRSLSHITHHLDYRELGQDVRRVLEEREPLEREVSAADGRWYIVRILPYRRGQDEIGGAVVTFFDITERHEIQERLAARELLFRTVFESTGDALFLFNLYGDHDVLTLRDVNANAAQRLGYSVSQLRKMTLHDLVDRDSVDLDGFVETLRHEGEVAAQMTFVTQSGERVDNEVSARCLDLEEGPLILAIGRKVQDQSTEERAAFVANLSHEIRTPLTSIIGASQLLGRSELMESERRMVRLIQNSGRRLQQTIDSVLDLSRIAAGEMRPRFSPVEVVAEVEDDIELLRPLAEEQNTRLEFDCSDAGFMFWTDVGFLHRIVINLVENAIKFTKDGRVTVGLERKAAVLCLSVSDTGVGISEEFMPYIFSKFKLDDSKERTAGGSGLGLTLVKSLVDIIGGSIAVASKQGMGTTFRVVIPEQRPEQEWSAGSR